MNSENLKRKADEAAMAVKRFNAHPPVWGYVVIGVVVVLSFQLLRHL